MALTQTNRKGIRDSAKQWSQRRNIPDEVWNDFIELALSKANRALRIPPLEAATNPVTDEGGYFELPSNFLEVKEIVVNNNGLDTILDRKAIDEVDYIASRSTNGNPCLYGRYGNLMRIAPIPEVDTPVRMYYYAIIPAMPDDTTENWFTLFAPEVLLYGTLAELAAYARDEESQARWDGKFQEAVGIIQKTEDRAAWWSGGPLGISLKGSTP
jgi:hypothetical protein